VNNTPQPVVPTSSYQLAQVRELFDEYAASLGFDLDFQGFESELERFPSDYREPAGFLLAVVLNQVVVGCVGVRTLERGVCEMKRMYVRPDHRGRGHGRNLACAAVENARERGFATMRLDTVEALTAANALYRDLGFERIEPYRYNPRPDAVYMERAL
jgi:putative acetyltransferase